MSDASLPVFGVCIPAHDEERHIGDALAAVQRAAAHPALAGRAVRVVVVADACGDATACIARAAGAQTLEMPFRNVGRARAAGAAQLLQAGAGWLAFTDADTCVAPDWLAAQAALAQQGFDAVCGPVAVDDWSAHGDQAQMLTEHFARTYFPVEGHRHIHGANFGVSAAAYRRAGGFAPLACSEDVALVAALEACGARIAWSAAPRVATSARTDARARGGFGDTLLAVVARHMALGSPATPQAPAF